MDAVSDVLRVVRLGGAVYLNGEFTAPWCVIGKADLAISASFLPRSERVVSYHLFTEGSCWARLAADPNSAIQVNAGELLVVPQGEAHILGSALDLPPVPAEPLLANHLRTAPGEVMQLYFWRRWSEDTTRMWLPGLRRDAVQPDTFRAAAHLQDRHAQRSALEMA